MWGGMYWIDPAQDTDKGKALVNAVMNVRDPSNAGYFVNTSGLVRF